MLSRSTLQKISAVYAQTYAHTDTAVSFHQMNKLALCFSLSFFVHLVRCQPPEPGPTPLPLSFFFLMKIIATYNYYLLLLNSNGISLSLKKKKNFMCISQHDLTRSHEFVPPCGVELKYLFFIYIFKNLYHTQILRLLDFVSNPKILEKERKY